MKALNALAVVLVIVGGLNWGLVALAEFDLVAWLVGEDFGQTNAASRIVYGLVGLAAVYWHRPAREPRNQHQHQHRRSSLRLHPGMKGTPMRKLILPIVVLVVALATAAVALGGNDSGSTAQPAAKPTKNIVQTAVAAGDFDTLVSLVKRAGLAKTLSGKGPFTVFAPTDAAFKKVPASTLEALLKDRAALRDVLLYHVAAGRYPAKRVVKQTVNRDAGRPARQGDHPRGHRPRGRRQGRPGRRAHLERRHPRHQQGPAPPLTPGGLSSCPARLAAPGNARATGRSSHVLFTPAQPRTEPRTWRVAAPRPGARS